MKKIVLIIALCLTGAFACVCSSEIIQAFKQFETKVKQSLNSQQKQLNANLKPKIESSIELLKEQNLQIKKANAVEANLEIKKENFIFLLQKKLEVEK